MFGAATGKLIATIPVGGKPEFAQADPAAGRVYVNIEDKNEVVAIDTSTHQIVSHWPIAPGEEAIDLVHHRLMLGCSNERVIIMDSTNGRVVANIAAGKALTPRNSIPAASWCLPRPAAAVPSPSPTRIHRIAIRWFRHS